MAEQINWTSKEEKARAMSDEALAFAISDCLHTIRSIGTGPMIGKDQSYYYDEISVYRTEEKRRSNLAKVEAAKALIQKHEGE